MADALRTQIGWCRENHDDAHFTADIIAAVLRDFEAGGVWRTLLGDWPTDPIADAVMVRAAGGVHRLALKGVEPFKSVYARLDRDPAVLDDVVRAAGLWPEMAYWISGPPQTNEVMRSAALLPGFLEIAKAQGLPLRMLEMGCSGGLNLWWDRYRYQLGDTVWGPEDSPVRLEPRWDGPSPQVVPLTVASRQGADRLPVDLSDPEQRFRLLSYVWADQAVRVARVRGALELARQSPPPVVEADAADWVEAQLAQLPRGTTTVLYHSYVWMYLPQASKARIRAALAQAGEQTDDQTGLAWLSFESVDGAELTELALTLWPGGERRRLALAHPHGRWIKWVG